MKIRFDFVTNSSSSSFIIGCREGLSEEMLDKLFRISDDHPLYDLLRDIADTILYKSEPATLEEIKEEYPYYSEKCEKYADRDFCWYYGRLEDEGFGAGPVESYLCRTRLNIETDDFIMLHDLR
jgi:hypothetical protein